MPSSLESLSKEDQVWFINHYNDLLDSFPYSKSYPGAFFDRTVWMVLELREIDGDRAGSLQQTFATADKLLKTHDRLFLTDWITSKMESRRLIAMQQLREAKIVPIALNDHFNENLTEEQLKEIYSAFGVQQ